MNTSSSMVFHADSRTGVIFRHGTGLCLHCDNGEPGYLSRQDAVQAIELDYYTSQPRSSYQTSRSLDVALMRAANGGFVVASAEYPKALPSQLALLGVPETWRIAANEAKIASSKNERAGWIDFLVSAAQYIASTTNQSTAESASRQVLERIDDKEISAEVMTESLLRQDVPATDTTLAKSAARLWRSMNSPLHAHTKSLLFYPGAPVDGYTPSEGRREHFNNTEAAASFNIDIDDLPIGVMAFDIETDTSRGFGLRPTRSQITEIVASTKSVSWVFSGDERSILESFANLLNNTPDSTLLVGWNNESFDNIAIQTRAQFHGVPNWRGWLTPTINHGEYAPVGPQPHSFQFEWHKTSGETIHSADIFQLKIELDRRLGRKSKSGLKPFLQSIGCDPVSVDRSRMHDLTNQERVDYALSDGLATLRACTEVARMRSESGLVTPGVVSSPQRWF